MNPVIIFGSSRSDGNTKQLVEVITQQIQIDKVYDLNDYNIGYFDYSFDYKNDDYLSLMEDILKYDELIIVSPVYWYALSAQLKTFF
ncbi:flavodoxin family protein [Pedobacter cryoconitis]|uniref:Multimeric flavodoxin WrbA n=1 Tax=Pedobacter cryoconitis TaxID=188932 RepID=A0A7X0J2N2_9SPHI|nr:NAD(P)H-dependent oxidoreductase [Pedobacter cryoconitis]MBB6499342.1 multimeric flavodoxin WrbA [Pedobacter cryoconitis]